MTFRGLILSHLPESPPTLPPSIFSLANNVTAHSTFHPVPWRSAHDRLVKN